MFRSISFHLVKHVFSSYIVIRFPQDLSYSSTTGSSSLSECTNSTIEKNNVRRNDLFITSQPTYSSGDLQATMLKKGT
jgi:hypothetical protein